MKNSTLLLTILIPLMSNFLFAQTISWPAGYQGLVANEQNKSFFIHFKDGTFEYDTNQSINIPIEASCLAYTDPKTNKLLFYSNGCKIYDTDNQIIPGSEILNQGALAEEVCGLYGYLMDHSMLAVRAPGHEDKVYIIHMTGEDLNDPFYQHTSLLYTTIQHSPAGTELSVVNINMPLLINKKLMPFSIGRHANGRDWWLVCAEKLSNVYHVFLIDPRGFNYQGSQSVGTFLSAENCVEGQRLLFSPNANLLARHTNCGIFLLYFDRCDGLLSFFTFQELPYHPSPGGDIAFSSSGRYLFVSRWYHLIRMDLNSIGISATPYTLKNLDQFHILHHMSLMPTGEILVDVPNSEKSMHLITNADDIRDYRFFPNFIQFPFHVMRSMPHLITADPGRIIGSPCDSIKTELKNVSFQNDFYIFPNPASESITLKNIINHPLQFLKIMDLQGKILFTQHCFDYSSHLNLNISYLSTGFYYLQIYTDRKTELIKFSKI